MQTTSERSTDGFRVLDLPLMISARSVDFEGYNNRTIQSKAGNANLFHVSVTTGGLIMDAKRRSVAGDKMAFVDMVCDMSRRGDISAVAETFEGYWTDKMKYPWHTLYAGLEKRSATKKPDVNLSNTLLLLRDAVFGALGLTSLSLALEMSTEEIVRRIVKEPSWKEARRDVRQYASDTVSEMIKRGEIAYLIPSGLTSDGLGFLAPTLRHAQLEEFRNSKPKLMRGKLDLRPLSRCILGRTLLRQLAIKEDRLDEGDPRGAQLLETYEHMLVDVEIGEGAPAAAPVDMEQVTIGGEPTDEGTDRKQARVSEEQGEGVQTNLTEYVGNSREDRGAKRVPRPPKAKPRSRGKSHQGRARNS